MNEGLKHSPKDVFQWPAISYEEVAWQESSEAGNRESERANGNASAAQAKESASNTAEARESGTKADAPKDVTEVQSPNRSPKSNYQAALPLLIANRSVVIPEELSTRISAILVEMARFDVELAQRADNVPTMLLRSESAASSQIDRLMSTPQSVALAELYPKAPLDAQLVVANMVATQAALELPVGLSLDGILEVHEALVAPQEEHYDAQANLQARVLTESGCGKDRTSPQASRSGDSRSHLDNANTFNALVAQGMTPTQALETIRKNREAAQTPQASTLRITNATAQKKAAQKAAKNASSSQPNAHTHTNSARERLRQKPVWLGGTSFTPHTALFVPPAFHRVPEYLEDLIEFGTRSDLNPIVKAAILYAQFVTVHPFLIGSGQTGRALIHHIFREDGILSSTIIPVSVGFLHNIDSLLDALHLYREGNPLAIVEELVAALEVALYISRVTETSVESLLEDWDSMVGHRKGSKIRQLPKTLVKQPVVNSAYLANTLGVTQRTATTLILRACEYGMLRRMGKKERGDFYQSDAIINVLDEINEASTFRTIRV